MKTLPEIQNELREFFSEGTDVALPAIKKYLRNGTDKYNELIKLEARYKEINKMWLSAGVLSDEAARLELNKIQQALLDFINDLTNSDLAQNDQPLPLGAAPDIYNGEVLYRIPKEMLVKKEVKCVVRVAFDRQIIQQDWEKQATDVLKDVRISDVMGVELLDGSGTGAFAIRTLTETVQSVDKDFYTEWIFYVKPLLEGTFSLVLRLAVIEIKESIERKRNVTLEEIVQIVTTEPEEEKGGKEFKSAGALHVGAQAPQGLPPGGGSRGPSAPSSTKPSVPRPSPSPVRDKPSPIPSKSGVNMRKLMGGLAAFATLIFATWAVTGLLKNDGGFKPPDEVAQIDEAKKAWDNAQAARSKDAFEDIQANFPKTAFADSAAMVLEGMAQIAFNDAVASQDSSQLSAFTREYSSASQKPVAKYLLKNWAHTLDSLNKAKTDLIGIIEPEKPLEPKITDTPKTPGKKDPKGKGSGTGTGKGKTSGKDGKTNTGGTKPDGKTETDTGTKTDPSDKTPETKPDPNKLIPVAMASRYPIFKDCDNSNQKEEEACTKKQIGRFVDRKLNYPAEAEQKGIQGTVVVTFIVETDGSITSVKAENEVKGGCSAEAVRIVQSLPKFKPALQNNQPVRVIYRLPITFKIN